MGHERHRDPGNGHQPDDHSDVDHELEQDHRGQPGPEHHPERVLRAPRRDEDPPQQHHEQADHDEGADEAELLGEDREHEVGVLNGQEVERVLCSVGEALAEDPS